MDGALCAKGGTWVRLHRHLAHALCTLGPYGATAFPRRFGLRALLGCQRPFCRADMGPGAELSAC